MPGKQIRSPLDKLKVYVHGRQKYQRLVASFIKLMYVDVSEKRSAVTKW